MLDPADLAALAAALEMSEGEFIEAHTGLAKNRAQLTLLEDAAGACEFLDAAGRCRVYAARPRQCRDFPHGWRVSGCPALGEAHSRAAPRKDLRRREEEGQGP